MREKIIEYLRKVAGSWDSYVIGSAKEIITYDEATTQILSLLREEIEKMEPDYERREPPSYYNGFAEAIDDILALFDSTTQSHS